MENRPKTTFKVEISRNPSNPKFKPVKFDHNQLQFKYDVYKNGSPNVYEQNLENLKAYPIKNNIKTLQLAGVQYILKEMKKISPNTGANHRDFNLHPSTIQKYSKKFRNLVSDSQQTKDFIDWFVHKQSQIKQKGCSTQQKFYLLQNLIATGFNEMVIHFAHVSKSRSQILKLLWNKQNKEVEDIFNQMNLQNIQFQKKNLERIKDLHLGYQQQIINLRNDNYCLQKKLQQAVLLNEGCINSIRVMRKQVKKYERMIKKLNEANYSLKAQSLQIFEQNVQLMMKDKNISHQKASILSCQVRQLKKMRKMIKKNKGTKEVFKQIKNKAEHLVETKSYNFQENKDRLIEGIKKRMKQNCHSKIYFSKSEFDEDEEEEIHLQSIIDNVINCKELRPSLQIGKNFYKGLFVNQATNTEFQLTQFQIGQQKEREEKEKQKKSEKRYDSVGVQVNAHRLENTNYKSLLNLEPNEEQQGKQKLKKMKMEQRHSLILIQMNKMMEFKKMDVGSRAKRISNTSNSIRKSIFGTNSINPRNSNFSSNNKLSEVQSEVDSNSDIQSKRDVTEIIKNDNQPSRNDQHKKRQQNFIRKHHESLIIQKGEQLKNLIAVITKQINQQAKQKPKLNHIKPHSLKQHHKADQTEEKLLDIKTLVRKYIQSKSIQKQTISNPEKHLRKILTDTFKNLFVSRKSNFLEELVRTAKNSFGKLIYENKLVHLISIIIECREKTLLSALTILLGIEPLDKVYDPINFSDVSEVYFKLYFYLTLKNPMQNQFNLWNNYTNLAKLNSSGFVDILKNYFSQSKCLYLNLKIREFIGITDNVQVDNNYYVQLNTLMTYILQVYMVQKQNYYESYHQMLDFLSDQEHIKLETLIFLMDLLCVKQFEQKEIVKTYFTYGNDQNSYNKQCHRDIFYRICVKYELPLFQFIKVMKLNQFKQIQSCLQSQLNQICEYEKWVRVKENLENLLRSNHKLVDGLSLILSRLDNYMKSKCNFGYFSEPFLFFYRIVIYNAFT